VLAYCFVVLSFVCLVCGCYLFVTFAVAGRCVPTVFNLEDKIDKTLILTNDSINPNLGRKVVFQLEAEYLRDIRDGTV